MKPKGGYREVSREVVEAAAQIIGPEADSARALAEADRHDGPIRFWLAHDATRLIVEKLPKGTEER